MKKFNKIIALVLALVLAIGTGAMPAFAAIGYPDDDGYCYVYTDDGMLSCAYWCMDSSKGKGPVIFYVEIDSEGFDNRTWAISRVQNGAYSVMYFIDADGDLWTDMPKYGGTLVAKKGTAEYDVALYGAKKLPTWYESWQKTTNTYTNVYRHGMGTPNTASFGFTDVKDNAWYADAVNALANTGILNGIGNNLFDPNGTMTWSHVYYVMFRLLGIDGKYLPETTRADGVVSFDTKVDIVNQVLGLTYKPERYGQPINRAEAAMLVTLVYSLAAGNYHDGAGVYFKEHNTYFHHTSAMVLAEKAVANGAKRWTIDDIPDGKLAASLVKDHQFYGIETLLIEYAYTLGIVSGYNDEGLMGAADSLTRAQFCQMLYNAGIIGCVYPMFNLTMQSYDLYAYLKGHYNDGSVNPEFSGSLPPFSGNPLDGDHVDIG